MKISKALISKASKYTAGAGVVGLALGGIGMVTGAVPFTVAALVATAGAIWIVGGISFRLVDAEFTNVLQQNIAAARETLSPGYQEKLHKAVKDCTRTNTLQLDAKNLKRKLEAIFALRDAQCPQDGVPISRAILNRVSQDLPALTHWYNQELQQRSTEVEVASQVLAEQITNSAIEAISREALSRRGSLERSYFS